MASECYSNTMQCNIELQSYLQSYAIFSHFLFHENFAGNLVSCSENRKKYDILVVEFTFRIVSLNKNNKSFFLPLVHCLKITKSSLDGWKLRTQFNSKIKNTSTRACPIVIPSWQNGILRYVWNTRFLFLGSNWVSLRVQYDDYLYLKKEALCCE